MPQPIDISASRGSAVLGLSEYRTQQDVWLDIMESREPGFSQKNGFIYEPFEGNASTRWGHAFEDAIVELAKSNVVCDIIHREHFYQYGDEQNEFLEFMTCHIDGWYNDYTALHEAKTTNAYTFKDKWGEPGTDRIPMDYMIQCQHQMACTGADEVILSVLVLPKRPEEWEDMGWQVMTDFSRDIYPPANFDIKQWAQTFNEIGNFHQYRIPRNQILIDEMIKHYTHFWNNHILNPTPPDPKKYDDIKKLLTPPVGTVILSEEMQRISAAYKMCTQEIGELNKLKDHYKTQIIKEVIKNKKVVDDGQQEKLLMMDDRGNKLHSYGGGRFR